MEKVKIFGKEIDLTKIKPSGKPKNKLVIGLDIDDTLVYLIPVIAEILSEEFNEEYTIDDFNSWGMLSLPEEVRARANELFSDEELYSRLPVMPHSKELIKELDRRGHRIVIVSATYFESMSARAVYVKREFPEVKRKNIILTASKDLLTLDVLFDDKVDNITETLAEVPVIVDQPWNRDLKNHIRALSGDDFLAIIDLIQMGYTKQDIFKMQYPVYPTNKPVILAITGSSGSGKTTIAEMVAEQIDGFQKVVTTTTREPRVNEVDGVDYNFLDKQHFLEKVVAKEFIEVAQYLDNFYGIETLELKKILEKNDSAVVVIEEQGIHSLKEIYGDDVIAVYIDRPEGTIEALLERDVSTEEKERRIIQLFEENVKQVHDYVIENSDVQDAFSKIRTILSGLID